ncbi:tail protein X [Zooshikella ganghwensis]|uniref:tail protein X n=1 Tax=Zooshikella ganghwensis TaxID=202772 RepID=UPI003B8A7643
MMMHRYRTTQGQTLDEIAWRYYGHTDTVVENILEANPGLAKLPTILPSGTIINLPDIPKQSMKPQVKLWD